MSTRNAHVDWHGTLMEGSGRVELTSSKAGSFDVTFPKRTADDADGTTSPEELIAAAHSSCYAMQLSSEIAKAGGNPVSLDVSAAVALGADQERGGLQITGITLTVRGQVEGLGAEDFATAAQTAKEGCPISKALAAVEITLDAALNS